MRLQFWNTSSYSFHDINCEVIKTIFHLPLFHFFFSPLQLGLLLSLFTLHQTSSGDIICSQVFGRAHSSEKYDKGDNMFINLCKREYLHIKVVLGRVQGNKN